MSIRFSNGMAAMILAGGCFWCSPASAQDIGQDRGGQDRGIGSGVSQLARSGVRGPALEQGVRNLQAQRGIGLGNPARNHALGIEELELEEPDRGPPAAVPAGKGKGLGAKVSQGKVPQGKVAQGKVAQGKVPQGKGPPAKVSLPKGPAPQKIKAKLPASK